MPTHIRPPWRRPLLASLIAAMLALVACGFGGTSSVAPTFTPSPTATPQPGLYLQRNSLLGYGPDGPPASAKCPANAVALSGGWVIPRGIEVLSSKRAGDSEWQVTLAQAPQGVIEVWVVCLTNA